MLRGGPTQGLKSPTFSRQFLGAVLSSPGPEPSSPFPSVPVSVPVSDPCSGLPGSPGPPGPHVVSKKGALQSRASRRHRGSIKDRGPQPPGSPQPVSSSPHSGRRSEEAPIPGPKGCLADLPEP